MGEGERRTMWMQGESPNCSKWETSWQGKRQCCHHGSQNMTEEICGSMRWHVTTTIVVVPVCSRYSSGVSDLHMTLTRFYVGQKFTCLSH